jgi:hypothetical protein
VELKLPLERSGKYVLEFGNVLFEVDPALGGRIVTFSLSGQNLLTNAAADKSNGGNYGSTFWPSPQMWGGTTWPPIPEVDTQPYAPTLDGTSIVMTQQAASVRGKVSVTKRFTAVLNAQAIDIQYTLTNQDTGVANWAPWEISRVAPSGLTFFPSGSSVVSIPASNGPLPASRVTLSDGVTWYKNQPFVSATAGDKGKYSADGAEGWLAHVSGNLLFIKRYADVPAGQAAPGEGDAELYAGEGYEEIEAQGVYQNMQPGASLTWTVRWYVRELSDPTMGRVGNAALTAMVREVIKQ